MVCSVSVLGCESIEAFFELGNMLAGKGEGRKVVFLDELPWMDTFRSDFMMAFEGFWNGWVSFRTDILLVVCGSATSWIIRKLLHNKDGFHNRVTARIRLYPFTLAECEEYAAERGLGLDRLQLATCYMALGGVAYYWSQLQRGKSADQNIDLLFFSAQDGLRDEFAELYSSLFSDSRPYEAIVRALGNRRTGLTREELLSALGKTSGGDLTRHLEELEECGFIRRYHNVALTAKHDVYQLVDNLTLFYFQFVEGTQSRSGDHWRAQLSEGKKNAWRGLAFERVALEHVRQIKAALGISGVSAEVYSWHCETQGEDAGAQIDLLLDRNDGIVNVCEMKWSPEPYALDKNDLALLTHRMELFRTSAKTKKSLHLTLVTASGLKHNEYYGRVQSEVTLDDLFAK